MFKVGNILIINKEHYIVCEAGNEYILTYKTNKEMELFLEEKYEWNINNLKAINIEIGGEIDKGKLETIKRNDIFLKYKEFYETFHKPTSSKSPKSFLNYSGKIYDHNEMVSLADASLDFWLTTGRYSEQFEENLAKFLGVKYALLTNSGSSANLLALSALTSPKLGDRRLKKGDEVITVAAGFPTTVAPIVQNGLIPVFVDVELGTYNICIEEIEQAISTRTKAIMIAHTMGNPFDLSPVLEIAQKYGLWIVEDNCDALGSLYKGKLTGTFGHIGTSSFYPPHHITMGEGGAVYTNDPLLKVIIESFRDWGRDCWCPSGCDNTCNKRFGWQLGDLPKGYDHKYTYSHIGYNLKVTDMQAAIGVEQLKKLPGFIEKRIKNFNLLKRNLQPMEEYLILPEATSTSEPSWFGFILTIRDGVSVDRNKVVRYLEEQHIQTRMLFAGNLIKQPAFKDVNYRVASDLKNTDKIMNDTFLVGVYPGLDNEAINYMSEKIIEAVKKQLNESI